MKDFRFFRSVGVSTRNVHLDWPKGRLDDGVAEGFKIGADDVIDAALRRSSHPDISFRPAAYLYRHFLELQLKSLLKHAKSLLDIDDDERIHGHKLQVLWMKLRPLLKRIWPEGDERELEIVSTAIAEFGELDPTGQEFRYGEDMNGKKSLTNAPRVISLENLKENMAIVHEFLLGCEAGISAYLDYKSEAQSYDHGAY